MRPENARLSSSCRGFGRMLITLVLFLGLPLALLAQASPSAGGPRFALVIGNSQYAGLAGLANPANDATDIAAALGRLGYTVDLLTNAELPQMEEAVVRLGNRLSVSRDGTGFFFYAGHGVQSSGANYLIPSNTTITSETFLRSKALSLQAVLDTLTASGNRLNVIVLDACRDNPFGWGRGGARGLNVVSQQPAGSIVAYATGAGGVAQDGAGRNGVFTGELLKHIETKGIDVTEVFRRTNAGVSEATGGRQLPAVYNQFYGTASLGGEAPAVVAAPVAAATAAPAKVPEPAKAAPAFGDLFVETVPDGAEILIDGASKGRSPLVVEHVAAGRVSVEARKDNMRGARDVDVIGDGVTRVRIELQALLGNLFVRSPVKEGIDVLVDGKSLGALSAGLFENVPAGEHEIVLSGGGYWWQGKCTVQPGKTVTLEAAPREVGAINYELPEEAEAELTAKDYSKVLRGSGTLENVPAQTYAVRATGLDYDRVETTATVSRGQTLELKPSISRTEAYRKKVAYDKLSADVARVWEYATSSKRLSLDLVEIDSVQLALVASEFRFQDLIDRVRSVREVVGNRLEQQMIQDQRDQYGMRLSYFEDLRNATRDIVQSDVNSAQLLVDEIWSASYATDELTSRARTLVYQLRVRQAEDRRKVLEAQLATKTRDRRVLRTASWISLGVGVAGAATSLVSYLLGRQTSAASPPPTAASVDFLSGLTYGGIAAAGGGAGLGLILFIAAPVTKQVEDELAHVRTVLLSLGAQ